MRARLLEILRGDASPARLGVAVGIGVLFSCSPFFGVQLLLALAVTAPFRFNKVAVGLGTQLSFPPLIPFIIFGSANLGEMMLHGRWLPLTVAELRTADHLLLLQRFGVGWLLGGLTLGAVLGAAIGTAVAWGARRLQARRAPPGLV